MLLIFIYFLGLLYLSHKRGIMLENIEHNVNHLFHL